MMRPLKVEACLWPHVVAVLEEARPEKVLPNTLFAVFRDSIEDGAFCGLATEYDIIRHPHWIFADLAEHQTLPTVTPGTDVRQAFSIMEEYQLNALSVLDNRKFVGAVTRQSILEALLAREKTLLAKSKRLHKQLDEEFKITTAWAQKLARLHEASRQLLGVLAFSSLETNLLQCGIDALTELVEARYGAIGILDDQTGSLKHFIHTGIAPELAQKIGSPPEGRGLLGIVVKENIPLNLDDMSKHPCSMGFPPHHPEMKSLLAVPISHHGAVYGRVYLSEKKAGDSFNKTDESITLSFAHFLSLMLDNAREVEEVKHAKRRLHYMAHFDPLTNLPNRTLLDDRILQAVSHAKRNNSKIAILFLDLDNFKLINDSLGHANGDLLLKIVADRLRLCLREDDTAARLGGDEFIVMLPDIVQAHDAATVAAKILLSLEAPINLGEHEVYISASIGVSFYPDNANNPGDLMAAADAAMYHAKKLGKNNYQFFNKEMNSAAQNYIKLAKYLRRAIEREELELHYQPQIATESGCVVGMEALLRWKSPEVGPVPPCDFIPLAEETNLILPIGAWVLRTACFQAQQWRQSGYNIRIAINLSARQFQQQPLELLDTVLKVLEASGLPPECLELEITETILMQYIDMTLDILLKLKNKGIRISVDDFGTGYSSLSYLKRFPIDTLKIDRSFVNDIAFDPNDKAIVAAIIAMAEQLKFETVAEGVENLEQLEFLRGLNCQFLQGFYFSKPLNHKDATAFLQNNRIVAAPVNTRPGS